VKSRKLAGKTENAVRVEHFVRGAARLRAAERPVDNPVERVDKRQYMANKVILPTDDYAQAVRNMTRFGRKMRFDADGRGC